ncbi:MAG: alpha-L-arabinofuranosidase, partial [Tidjanibacter sp.]|nr:alpha-L-arabinofuranosidase [Tidjanibacter sp.]
WKTTVGPIEDRKLIINRWNTEFAHKFTPDYFQSFGLGFYEYFLLSEDIGAEPLPILNCGMACQYNTGELVPLEEIGPYVQDALDLIEFANGSTDTEWGALRASMGHPEPFNLKYLGIGNEQWGPQFFERYAFFEKAIMEKHPEIIIVSTAGPSVDTDLFYYAQEQLPKYNAPIVDEHFYRSPEWFFENAARYDSYDRDGYIVFAGEYAAQSVGQGNPNNKNNWLTALSEAAFMTGLERNADIVQLSSYAPMLANADAWQWTPDLIWFNNMETYGTPNYYVQKLYATNRGTEVLDMSLAGAPLTGQHGIFATAAYDEPSGEIIIKIVNRNAEDMEFSMELKSEHDVADTARKIVLASDDLEAMNSFENPTNIAPVESEINTDGKNVTLTLDGQSMTILRIKRN